MISKFRYLFFLAIFVLLTSCAQEEKLNSNDDMENRIKNSKIEYLEANKDAICKKTNEILLDNKKYYDWLGQYYEAPILTEENKDRFLLPGDKEYGFPLDVDLSAEDYFKKAIKPIMNRKMIIAAYMQYGIKLRNEDPKSIKAMQYLVLASIAEGGLLVADDGKKISFKLLGYQSTGYEFPICYVIPECNIDENLKKSVHLLKNCPEFRKIVKNNGLSKIY